jgi:glutaminyl-tRNA synthetase
VEPAEGLHYDAGSPGDSPHLIEDGATMPSNENSAPLDFIRQIVEKDLASGKNHGRVMTRFPPEPNGYLHIGHAKSICLNFGIASQFGGTCNLRFDDTNPEKEEQEYVDSIIRDVSWLGFDWEDRLFYASDYYHQLYDYAEQLILAGDAYGCDLSAEEVRGTRGTLTEPGSVPGRSPRFEAGHHEHRRQRPR